MHTPFRSEPEIFRAVVIIGIAAAAVIVLAVAVDPMVGGLLAALLIGLGVGYTLRRSRGNRPPDVKVARNDDDVHRILVAANQTVEGSELLTEIRNRARGHERVELLVVSPATAVSRLQHLASDTDAARAEAAARLERSIAALKDAGFEAQGRTGEEEDPFVAIEDALRVFSADELIISTLPPDRSRWLERGLVEHARSELDLPVSHVIVEVDVQGQSTAVA